MDRVSSALVALACGSATLPHVLHPAEVTASFWLGGHTCSSRPACLLHACSMRRRCAAS